MRTLLFIVGGFALWGLLLAGAKLFSKSGSAPMAAANTWIGVSRAGYTVLEELPIFLLIFLLPAAVAILVKWKFM
ncbi:MAG TPA: hypothetical protein VGA24_04895 [Steroidobacteraceae bacterium]